MIVAYTPSGQLDKTFGSNGLLTKGTNPIFTHIIDTNNKIVVAYNDGSNNVAIARYLSDGSALDTTFGTNGIIATGIRIAGISGDSNMRIAIDANNYIVAAAVVGQNIVVTRYTANGSAVYSSQSLTITGGASGMLGGNSLSAYTIAKLLIDVNGQIIIIASDTHATQVVTCRTTANLSGLDTLFNPSTGYIRYAVAGGVVSQVATNAMILPTGLIAIVGEEA